MLKNKTIQSAIGKGIFVDIHLDQDTHISINDGVNMRYGTLSQKRPEKYQLLLEFNDSSYLVFTVAMYGCIYAHTGQMDNDYHKKSMEYISPLDKAFNAAYFDQLINGMQKNISLKAFLATEQRIPGLGNGVLQDILFNAGMHPKRKIQTLAEEDRTRLFRSVQNTLQQMTDSGGRDTETNLFGQAGGYKTLLSKNTYKLPCPKCGHAIIKESYLGGTIYYCSICQPV